MKDTDIRLELKQDGFSASQIDVALLVGKGLSNKEIANTLFVVEKTVKMHLTNIYKKLGLKSNSGYGNRTQVIIYILNKLNRGV
jgi:DNA-binding NarL/FixJ family response regulator